MSNFQVQDVNKNIVVGATNKGEEYEIKPTDMTLSVGSLPNFQDIEKMFSELGQQEAKRMGYPIKIEEVVVNLLRSIGSFNSSISPDVRRGDRGIVFCEKVDDGFKALQRELAAAYFEVGLQLRSSEQDESRELGEEFYRRSAELGNPDAKRNLASIHYNRGGVKNIEIAVQYLESIGEPSKNIDKYLIDMYCALGEMYRYGHGGVHPDRNKAAEWYGRASKLGDKVSAGMVKELSPFVE